MIEQASARQQSRRLEYIVSVRHGAQTVRSPSWSSEHADGMARDAVKAGADEATAKGAVSGLLYVRYFRRPDGAIERETR